MCATLNRAHPRGARVGVVTMSSRAGIRALAEGVRESKENANNLVDLLDHLQVRASSTKCPRPSNGGANSTVATAQSGEVVVRSNSDGL